MLVVFVMTLAVLCKYAWREHFVFVGRFEAAGSVMHRCMQSQPVTACTRRTCFVPGICIFALKDCARQEAAYAASFVLLDRAWAQPGISRPMALMKAAELVHR
jgi:hypothetical protein